MKKLYLVLTLSLIFVSCGINNDVEHQIDLKKCQNDEDKISGCVEESYLLGIRTEIPYKNGKIEGIMKLYDENGNLYSEIPFKNDKPEGIAKLYDENGNLVFSITAKNDEAISGECENGKNISSELFDSSEKEILDYCNNKDSN